MKVLFTNAYFYRLDEKQWQLQKPYPPYGTIVAAAVAQKDGHDVALFDSSLETSPNNIQPIIAASKPYYFVVYDDNFNYLSKMCLTVMRNACFEMMALAKAAGCKVLVNSSDATDNPFLYLQAGADVVMNGEAELTLLELLQEDTPIEQCLGISYLVNEQLVTNPKRQVLTNLELLPMPAWDLINIYSYRTIWMQHHGYFSLNIATTRGCPFKCNWCAKPIYGNRYNTRDAASVVAELNMLYAVHDARHYWICDDIFGLKPSWLTEFNKLLKTTNIKPKLKIQCRADLLLKEDTIKNLLEAGLDEVWMGAESGSQKVLDAMDKGTTIQQIYEATTLLKKHGVKVCLFLQYGYLGENASDINLTLQMLKDLLPHDIGISVSYPLPGTGFYNKVKEQLKYKQNWTDSDDLAMMYKGTFSPSYYKHLYSHTHKVFHLQKSKFNLQNIGKLLRKKDVTRLKAATKLPYYWLAEKWSYLKLKSLA
ncbi:MAG: radical SAM protein [Flavobacterium sp.]|nr:radical SAM protein [Flavobacterium sp.]